MTAVSRFRELMIEKYPWGEHNAVDAELGARLLWDHTRNPLSHTLGVGKTAELFPGIDTGQGGVWLSKPEVGLPEAVVERLMRSYERPDWVGATVGSEPGGYVVNVVALSWGVQRMLRNLFEDAEQTNAAEMTAQSLLRS